MAQALYRVGESVGPGTVVADEFTVRDGRTIEHVVTSWGQQMLMHGREQDTSYHAVCRRLFGERVLIPYTVRHLTTELGVEGAKPTWVNVGKTPYDYWRVLCDWWVREELIVIEHDVQARPSIFDEFDSCPEPWCFFRYDNHSPENADAWRWATLGCTRFRAEIIKAVPDAVTGIEERHRDWHYLSTGLGIALRDAGFEPHMHESAVNHHRMMDVGGVVAAMDAA